MHPYLRNSWEFDSYTFWTFHIPSPWYTPLLSKLPNILLEPNSWIIDLGATQQACSNPTLFLHLILIPPISITLPNWELVEVNQKGLVQMTYSLLLQEFLYVLSFNFNFVSVSSLISSFNRTMNFTSSSCVIQDLARGWTIEKGRVFNHLYLLDMKAPIWGLVSMSVDSLSYKT